MFGRTCEIEHKFNTLSQNENEKASKYLSNLQLPMQSVHITTNVVSSNPSQAKCTRYNIM